MHAYCIMHICLTSGGENLYSQFKMELIMTKLKKKQLRNRSSAENAH